MIYKTFLLVCLFSLAVAIPVEQEEQKPVQQSEVPVKVPDQPVQEEQKQKPQGKLVPQQQQQQQAIKAVPESIDRRDVVPEGVERIDSAVDAGPAEPADLATANTYWGGYSRPYWGGYSGGWRRGWGGYGGYGGWGGYGGYNRGWGGYGYGRGLGGWRSSWYW